jgi:PAS domain S-box-containing protein
MNSPETYDQQAYSDRLPDEYKAGKLRSLFMQAPAAIALLEGPQHLYTFANPLYQKVFNRTEEQLIGKSPREAFPEVEGQGIYELFDQVYLTGKPFTAAEFPATFQDGDVLKTGYYNFVIQPIRNSEGDVSDLMVHVYEVTKQVEAHKKTEESENKYRGLFNSMEQGFCVIEMLFDENGKPADYRFLDVNPVFESQTGLKNAAGKTARELVPGLEEHWFQLYGEVALTGKSVKVTEGSEAMGRWFEVNAFRLGSGQSRKVAILFTDITERKAADKLLQENKQLLQTVFDTSPNSLTVFEPVENEKGEIEDFKFIMVNEFTVQTTGRDDLAGKRYSKEFPNVIQSGVLEKFIKVATTGVPDDFERWYQGEGLRHWFRFIVNKVGKLLVVTTEDITKRKQAEEAIKESQNQLTFAIEATELGVWDYNPETHKFKANDRLKDWYGLQPEEEIDAEAGIAMIAEADRQRVVEAMQKSLQWGGGDYDIEYTIVHPITGQERIVRAKGKASFNEHRVAQRFNGTLQDVTPQAQARQQIEESRERLSNIISQVNAGIAQTTTHGQFTNANERFCEITGYSKEELLAQTIQSITHPDDWPRNKELVIKALTEGKNFLIEKRYIRKDGSIVWVSNSVSIVTDSKGEKFVTAISVDITDQIINRQKLEESEERFRSMADASPVMIWTLDEAGNSTYYNSRAAEFTGHTEEQIRAGKSWQVAIHPDDIDYASAVVGHAVVNRLPYQMECRMQRADGEWRWLLNQGTPRFGKEGDYFGFVGTSIDITEHKNSQQALQTALEQIRLSKEAAELGTFDMDLEKGTMHWDDRCRTLFGISHHGPVTYERDFAGGLHPDDRDRILKLIERLFDKSVSNGDYDVEYRTIGVDDGVVRWVRAKGKVYFGEGEKPLRFIGSVLDITEKVTAIQRIEALVEERTKELAQANEALQKMNRELQRSNQNLEEFAHAASHDLKEPVRKIHFFTHQLRTQLSAHLGDAELRSFNRIENASQRMGNLIDDLLLYSHVSHRPQETDRVNLSRKVQNVLEDLELDIAEKGADIHVEQLPVVNGYSRQLQQLLQNLISNALKYSKANVAPRIHITASKVAEGGCEYHLIEVKDNGIGFEPEYADKIFQMFTRLHGKTEYSGTGVGLSIVKKVVENHQGFIRVESEVGVGSTFKIYLPV